MEDPISNKEYETSVEGMKTWCANETAGGLGMLYAGLGFVVMMVIFSAIATVLSLVVGFSIPMWAWVLVVLLSLFWAFGGWMHGEELQQEYTEEFEPDTDVQLP